MKEYLEEQEDGAYKLVLRGDAIKPDDIEVPDGFVMLARPYKDADLYFYNQDFSIYYTLCGTKGKCGLGKNHKFHKIIWQRSETEYLMQGKNGERLMESVGQLKDNVNQPNHYTSGGIECLDAMQAMLSRDEFIGFLRGNVFKYNWRYKLKNGIEDLKKAQFYQNKLIELESDDAI